MVVSLWTCDRENAYLYVESEAAKLAADRCTVCSGAAAQYIWIVVVTADIPHLQLQTLKTLHNFLYRALRSLLKAVCAMRRGISNTQQGIPAVMA